MNIKYQFSIMRGHVVQCVGRCMGGFAWGVVILLALFVAGCAAPAPSPPPAESPWQTGTPEPLFAPLTGECLAEGDFPPQFDGLRYGLNTFLFGTDRERALTLSRIAGARWIRQQIHWRDLEGERGQYVWKPLDQIVSAVRAHDMRLMLSVVRSPSWATEGGDTGMPDDMAAFAAFLEQVATRYRGRVSAYEIWNEPNLSHESGGRPGDPSDYLAILQAAYPAIKGADPCALVLSAPMAATNNPDPRVATDDLPFYEQLYALEDGAFLRFADAVAVHPGGGPFPPDAHWLPDESDQSHAYFRHIERVHEIMRRYGDERQVWITEVGWTVTEAEGAPPPVTEQQQADYLVDMLWYVRQRYPWVAGVFVWNLNFSVIAPPGDEKTTFSILDADWSVRPAFLTLQHNIAPLRDADLPPHITDGATHRFAWTFPGRGAMPFSPRLASDGSVQVVSAPGLLYTVTPTGTLQYVYRAPGVIGGAPALAPDGMRYVGNSGSLLEALALDGTVVWDVRLDSPVRGSPVYYEGYVYVVNETGIVQAFDRDGGEVWRYDFAIETTPLTLAHDGTLLVGLATGEIVKLSTASSRTSGDGPGEIRWRTATGGQLWARLAPDSDGGVVVVTVGGGVMALGSGGDIRWQTDLSVPVSAAPLVARDQTVYVAARDGGLTALDFSDGGERWRFESGSDLHAAPVRGSDGLLYLGTEDERLLVLSEGGQLVWTAYLRGAVRASPLLTSDGVLFVSTMGGRLYALSRGGG